MSSLWRLNPGYVIAVIALGIFLGISLKTMVSSTNQSLQCQRNTVCFLVSDAQVIVYKGEGQSISLDESSNFIPVDAKSCNSITAMANTLAHPAKNRARTVVYKFYPGDLPFCPMIGGTFTARI